MIDECSCIKVAEGEEEEEEKRRTRKIIVDSYFVNVNFSIDANKVDFTN